MIEDSFGIVGAITEVILMSGIREVVKVKLDKSKPFLKRFGVEWQPAFKDDMLILKNAAI